MPDEGVNVRYRGFLLVTVVALVLLTLASVVAVTLLASSDRITLALSTITAIAAPTIGVIILAFKADKIEAAAKTTLHEVNGHSEAIAELREAVKGEAH